MPSETAVAGHALLLALGKRDCGRPGRRRLAVVCEARTGTGVYCRVIGEERVVYVHTCVCLFGACSIYCYLGAKLLIS
jgi:hypothetical protein